MKKTLLLLVMGFILMVVFATSSPVLGTTAGDCTGCHNQQALNFDVNLMSRTTTCYVCHGGASHALWRDPVTGRTKYAVWIAGSGYFRTTTTINSNSSSLHQYHSLANSLASRSDCNMCHGVALCTACHTSSTISHRQHGSTAFSPATFSQANGTVFAPQTLSCAMSQCHQKMPSVLKTNTDGSQLCKNCHPHFGYSAKDSAGHEQTAIDSRHAAPGSGTLNFVTGPQSVTCTGCHNSNLGIEHENRGKDCLVCHNPSGDIPASVKSVVLNAKGDQSKRACTLCHFNSSVLTAPAFPSEHATYHIANLSGTNTMSVVGGPHANCDTCHNTTTPLVVSATVDGAVYQKSIPELAAAPTKTYSCFGCHNTDNNLAPKHKALLDGQEMELTEQHAGCTTCHNPNTEIPAKVANIVYNLESGATSYQCIDCHSGATLDAGHTGVIDEKCQICHNSTLTTEHLNNTTTAGKNLSCATCHKSTKPEVRLAITVGNTNCLACHNQAHNFSMTQPVPSDIPLYPGYEWSTPQPADVWAAESWMPDGYEGGKLLISNRRTDVTGAAVWAYYKENMAANGWVVPTTEPDASTNFFNAEFTKGLNKVTIFFYGGENHTATPVVTTGYRLEVLYR